MFYFGEPSKQKSYQIVDLKKKCQTAECDAEGVLDVSSFHIYSENAKFCRTERCLIKFNWCYQM